MIQLYFANLEVCEDLLAGPMGPYLPALAVKLFELGYSRGRSRGLLATADALGRWLKRRAAQHNQSTFSPRPHRGREVGCEGAKRRLR